jgi:nitrite reductase/ring-hydroxylating ferredoxin subunit
MKKELREIIREEFENVLSKIFSGEEISDAINNKHFIHTRGGSVYSPVVLQKDFVVGIDNDCQHVNVPLKEITLIQSAEDRFRGQ